MTICPQCEMPIRTGHKVIGTFLCDFIEEPGGVIHGVSLIEELVLTHDVCGSSNEGD